MIRLQKDRLLVEVLDQERVSKLILTPIEDDANTYGLVHAVGPGGRDEKGNTVPMIVKVGDKVLFSGFMGVKIELKGKNYLIMKESDLFGIIAE